MWQEYGWDSVLFACANAGYFNLPNYSPIESVMVSECYEVFAWLEMNKREMDLRIMESDKK